MPDKLIRTEHFKFYYCRQGACVDCPGERDTALLNNAMLEERCSCACHAPASEAGSQYRVEQQSAMEDKKP